MTDHTSYTDHAAEAARWLRQSESRVSPEAGMECVATAQVHATLAMAAALDGIRHAVAGINSGRLL